MKIVQVRFKNLNSLVGEWTIDLTHPAFIRDGIFAITGPTGAGKTTILDAICLALYGRTPRLNKVTKAANEIMSRQTGECFAEVTFETQTGRYRCHWSQHRARRKPGGELQPPKQEISAADSGKIYETRLRGVAEQIEEITGMDFDRFTRSMLLAQGGFDTFLKAEGDRRAPVLEQITGTAIYSRISVRVHELRRQAWETWNLLQAETAGIALLDAEQEQALNEACLALRSHEAGLSSQYADTEKAIAWRSTIDELQKELAGLSEQQHQLNRDRQAFEPQRNILRQALAAASLEGVFSTLTAARNQHHHDRNALLEQQQTLPGLESQALSLAQAAQAAEQHTAACKAALVAMAPTLQQVRALDQSIADRRTTLTQAQQQYLRDSDAIEHDKRARQAQYDQRARAAERLDTVRRYLTDHAQDAWLVGGLAGLEEQLNDLLARQRDIDQKELDRQQAVRAQAQAEQSLQQAKNHRATAQEALNRASTRLQEGKAALEHVLGDRLLREYRTEKESLLREMTFLARIAQLEDHRSALQEGKPCPLCGATSHPYAQGNTPAADAIEQRIGLLDALIQRAEAAEAAIKTHESAEQAARTAQVEAEKQELAAVNQATAAQSALDQITQQLGTWRTTFTTRLQALTATLQHLDIPTPDHADLSTWRSTLRARLTAWQEHTASKTDADRELAELNIEITRLDAVIDTQHTALAQAHHRVETLTRELAQSTQARETLYGNESPDKQEQQLTAAIALAEQHEKQARDHYQQRHQHWLAAKTQVEALQRRLDTQEPELSRHEQAFRAALALAGFADEPAFLRAQLPVDQRDTLAERAKSLDDLATGLAARRNDRQVRLAHELEKHVTDQFLHALHAERAQLQTQLAGVRDEIAGISHRLAENAAAKARIKEKQAALEAQRNECRRWDNLHELIGSADGKKYRNFAQGLTFDMLIGHANQQLGKMTDRYLLVRDQAQPLELNVIDNYQAGDTRSTKNLSGGESFIVSLALALGLSRMSSRNVRVDSLFLDEGFGTLDEDALDTALDTLAGLHAEGKMIGVISHVPALKERISAQILVTPYAGGRSRLSGPGCRQG
jgi:exonuclease SbcC